MTGPDVAFWQERFGSGTTPWDRGEPSPQLANWIGSGALRPCRILVPGCGSGYEVASLAQSGFEVTGLDYAPAAVARTRDRVAALAPVARAGSSVVQADALVWRPEAPFDAIYEQTCLCALYPDLWVAYAAQLRRWLRPGGNLYALFMQAPRAGAAEGRIEGPPYHCDVNAMRALLPAPQWHWPRPPFARVPHPAGVAELAVVLGRAG